MGEEILAAEAARNDYAIAWSARGNPVQLALLECPIFEVFFGGARGGGKTDGMLGEWVRHADLYGEHAIGLMLRRTRTELIETIERSRAIYGLMGWTYHETDKMWRAPNGARRDQQSERPLRHATQKGKMCSLRTILSDIIAQCLNLEEEFEHDASKLCIFGFEALK
jgi:hypothetical protein